jgi:hypothetical protein
VGGMKTRSLDPCERILAADDAHEGTREEMANDDRVFPDMVKPLLQPRRHTGDTLILTYMQKISRRWHRGVRVFPFVLIRVNAFVFCAFFCGYLV